MADLPQNYREFLENPYYAVVTTLRPDGSPHNTVVWLDVNDDGVAFNTSVGRAKERHIANDPRVAVMVVDPANAYHWVSISGTGELTTEGADAHIDKMAQRYLGQDKYPYRQPGEQRVLYKIRIEKTHAMG